MRILTFALHEIKSNALTTVLLKNVIELQSFET